MLREAQTLLNSDKVGQSRHVAAMVFIQKYVRKFVAKAKHASRLHTRRMLQQAALNQDVIELDRWLKECEEVLPYAGSNLNDVAAARRVGVAMLDARERASRTEDVIEQLETTVRSKDLHALYRLVAQVRFDCGCIGVLHCDLDVNDGVGRCFGRAA